MLRHSSPHLRLSLRTLLPAPSTRSPLIPVAGFPYRPENNFRLLLRSSFYRFAVDEKSSSADAQTESGASRIESPEKDGNGSWRGKEDYPSGELDFRPYGPWTSFVVKLRMLFAWPWERVRKGSVLSMKLRGPVSDQLQSRFSSRLSLPQICENFIKAAYDPRISGIFLQIEPLECGWGKIEEIRRHILDFKKSGVFEKIGIEPQVQRIGKYKSTGDLLSRKSMSKENCEMLTTLLDNIYGNWLDTICSTRGKKRDEIEIFLNEGIYEVHQLKENGWITDISYEDEVMDLLKERLGQKGKKLLTVDYKKYSKVRNWTLGLAGGRDQIAIIRASGSINRVRSPLSASGSGIIADKFIEKIRSVRESKKYKAVVIRIDSPGGDALASDLMWREIRLLAESVPVIASMSDVAASGGYYMAMAAGVIVAENLTLTGSIGVVTGEALLPNFK